MMKPPVFFLFSALLCSALAIPFLSAQSSGTASGSAGSGTGSGVIGSTTGGIGARTPGQANPSTPSINSSGTAGNTRPIFISGKVLVDDGTPVPPNITIQRICSGTAHAVAYTDGKGHFSFQWGQTAGIMADASEAGFGSRNASPSGGFGGAQSAGGGNGLATDPFGNTMMNCELRAEIAGYQSSSVRLFNRNSMDTPEIGSIVLHRNAAIEGSAISATSFMAPKEARKSYEKGLQSLLKNKPDDAAKDFEKAVAEYPKYADAWTNLGKIRIQQKSWEPAREALRKAIEADGKLVGPYVELGYLAAQEQKWQDASEFLDRAMKLDPIDFPKAWYVDAVANFNLKKYDAAEKSAREAVKLDPKHSNPREGYLLGLVLIEKKDYDGAATELKGFLKLAPNAPDADAVKGQLADLEKILQETKEAAK